jgi:hypothetical protein
VFGGKDHTLRVLVAGCGNMGASHARAYHRMSEFRIVGLVSRGPASRHALSAEMGGLPEFGDCREALGATRPDVVSINTCPETHSAHARAAIEAGCHVFCEKPLATTAEDAQATVDAARAHGRNLVIGYMSTPSAIVRSIRRSTKTWLGPWVALLDMAQLDHGTRWTSIAVPAAGVFASGPALGVSRCPARPAPGDGVRSWDAPSHRRTLRASVSVVPRIHSGREEQLLWRMSVTRPEKPLEPLDEALFLQVADETERARAVPVEDGRGGERQAEAEGSHLRLGPPEHGRIGDPRPREERFGGPERLRGVRRCADKPHAAGVVLTLEPGEQGQLPAARRAPGRPEVHDHDSAAMLAKLRFEGSLLGASGGKSTRAEGGGERPDDEAQLA